MGKLMTDAMIDGGLDAQAACVLLTVCAGQPTSFADIAARKLASAVLAGGDFAKANGDVSGRKITTAAKSGMSITASGTADHVAIDDGTDYIVTTVTTPQALVSGGTVSTPAIDREIGDPT